MTEMETIFTERTRIHEEYARRARDSKPDTYAVWQPDVIQTRSERLRVAATMLHQANSFPQSWTECLEVGCGSLGWLGELISWRVPESKLHGVDLSSSRVQRARTILPNADLRVGDATSLPWPDRSFDLVIASTVLSSVLDADLRQRIACEINRVLREGGTLLWYDLRVNNPGNPNVQCVGKQELRRLFPQLAGNMQSVTLAPPICRFIAKRNQLIAAIVSSIPLLRTHLIAVLKKHDEEKRRDESRKNTDVSLREPAC